MNNDEQDYLAILSGESVMERYVRSLPEGMRQEVEETQRQQAELLQNIQRMMIGNPSEAYLCAEWVREHCVEVSYRWAILRENAIKWAEKDFPSIFIKIK